MAIDQSTSRSKGSTREASEVRMATGPTPGRDQQTIVAWAADPSDCSIRADTVVSSLARSSTTKSAGRVVAHYQAVVTAEGSLNKD